MNALLITDNAAIVSRGFCFSTFPFGEVVYLCFVILRSGYKQQGRPVRGHPSGLLHVYRNAPRLSFSSFGERQRKHTILNFGFSFAGVESGR